MPGPLVAGYELQDTPTAADKEVGRYLKPTQAIEVRIRAVIEAVGEQVDDFGAAILARRQADRVHHRQCDALCSGAGAEVG